MRDNAHLAPKALIESSSFDWEGDVTQTPWSESIIYELHVKGFYSVARGHSGSNSGTCRFRKHQNVIAYLKELELKVRWSYCQ